MNMTQARKEEALTTFEDLRIATKDAAMQLIFDKVETFELILPDKITLTLVTSLAMMEIALDAFGATVSTTKDLSLFDHYETVHTAYLKRMKESIAKKGN